MKLKPNLGVLLLSVFLALVSGLAVSGLLTTSKTLSSTGSVKAINVEVYWDDQCTLVVESIDWGTPELGDILSKMIYVKNTGNSQMILNMSCSGWDPVGVDSYLALSWNRDGAIIDVDEVVQAILTFSVSESISGVTDFSFNIIIEGTG